MRRLSAFVCALALAIAPHAAFAASAEFTDAQKAQIESIVRTLLVEKNPEIVMQAAQEMQGREEKAQAETAKKAVSESKDLLFNDKNSPVGGNPKGDVTVVEFYDYQCGYCKMAQKNVEQLLKNDKNVRFVYKELPILGPESVKAAKASLASNRQGKFEKFHAALMSKKDHLSDAVIDEAAKSVGLDIAQLHKDMEDSAIQATVDEMTALGQKIGARGTPMFIIGEETFPGAIPYEQMKDVIDNSRAGSNKKK